MSSTMAVSLPESPQGVDREQGGDQVRVTEDVLEQPSGRPEPGAGADVDEIDVGACAGVDRGRAVDAANGDLVGAAAGPERGRAFLGVDDREQVVTGVEPDLEVDQVVLGDRRAAGDREQRLGEVDVRLGPVEREPLERARVLLRVGRSVEDALAAEVDRRLVSEVPPRRRVRGELGLGEELLLEVAGGGRVVEDGLAPLVQDRAALAVERADLVLGRGGARREGVGQHGLVVFGEGKREVAPGLDHDGVAVDDRLVAEPLLPVARLVEGEQRERHLERDVAGDPTGVDRLEREQARTGDEREAGAVVQREDALVAAYDDGDDSVGLEHDRLAGVDRVGNRAGAVEDSRTAQVELEPAGRQLAEVGRQDLELDRGRLEDEVAAVRQRDLARLVQEEAAVEVEHRPAELVEHRLAAEVADELAGRVQRRVVLEVEHRRAVGVGEWSGRRIGDGGLAGRVEVEDRIVRALVRDRREDVGALRERGGLDALAAEVEALRGRVIDRQLAGERAGEGEQRAGDGEAGDRLVGVDGNGPGDEVVAELERRARTRRQLEHLGPGRAAEDRIGHPHRQRDGDRAGQRDRVRSEAGRGGCHGALADHGDQGALDRRLQERLSGSAEPGERLRQRALVQLDRIGGRQRARVDPVERDRHRVERAVQPVERAVDDQEVVAAAVGRVGIRRARERHGRDAVDLDQRRQVEPARSEGDRVPVELRGDPVGGADGSGDDARAEHR